MNSSNISALIERLASVSGEWGMLGRKPPEVEALSTAIAVHGFEAVPCLIQHLDDERLTHSMVSGFNNFHSFPRRVCDIASDMLQGIAGEDMGRDWLRQQQGYGVDKSSALKWWSEAQGIGEQAYVLRHVINDNANEVCINPTVLVVMAAKFPQMLPGLCRRLVQQYPKLDCYYAFNAYLNSSLPKEQKLEFFLRVIGRSPARTSFYALRMLMQLDRTRGESELIQSLGALPEDVSECYWRCGEAALTRLVVETDNPLIWAALFRATRRAKVGLRMQLMEGLNYLYLENRQINQRIAFLKAFLLDHEIRTIKAPTPLWSSPVDAQNESQSLDDQYRGPCAAFTFPTIEVRHFAAMQIGTLVQIKGDSPRPNWTSEQREEFHAKILQATSSS